MPAAATPYATCLSMPLLAKSLPAVWACKLRGVRCFTLVSCQPVHGVYYLCLSQLHLGVPASVLSELGEVLWLVQPVHHALAEPCSHASQEKGPQVCTAACCAVLLQSPEGRIFAEMQFNSRLLMDTQHPSDSCGATAFDMPLSVQALAANGILA